MFLSRQLAKINPSATLVISQKVREMRAQGIEVIGLGAGEPDFGTPAHIIQAAQRAMEDGQTRYTNVDGIPELKAAICAKFKRDNGLEYTTDQINVSPGGKPVIFNALLASIDPGDEVIIPTPCWVSYPEMVKLVGGVPIAARTTRKGGYKLSPAALEKLITPKTKWLFLNSPSNPTGVAYGREELEGLAQVLRAHPHVWVLSDDIYEHILYGDFAFATMAQVAPDLFERTLTMNGVSKAYAMTGWRIGYGAGPQKLIKAMANVMSQPTSNAASISQWAAAAALNGPQDFITARNQIYKQRRDLVGDKLNAITGLECPRPDGAFYVFPDCTELMGKTTPKGRLLESDMDFAAGLLDEAHVAVVPGIAFHARRSFRISYSVDRDDLVRACDRIGEFVASLGGG